MKTKIFLLALALTCSIQESYSMFQKIGRRVITVKKTSTLSLGQKRLLQERLTELGEAVLNEKAIIYVHTTHMGWDKYCSITRGYQIAQARNRKQDLEKQAFDIKMKLEKK